MMHSKGVESFCLGVITGTLVTAVAIAWLSPVAAVQEASVGEAQRKAFARVYPTIVLQASAVKAVYDGDTFTVDIPGWPEVVGKGLSIRVLGIDTPERLDPDPRVKALARKATDRTVTLLRESKVIELRRVKRDKYFRLDAEVFVDGKSLGETLLKEGLAKPYTGQGPRPVW